MSYENAPATKMLATHCACCARPLVDAISVEAGVGPDCRKKYSYAEAQGNADWTAAQASLRLAPGTGYELPDGWNTDAHKACNVLVYRVALLVQVRGDLENAQAACIANAIRDLGYHVLADKIMDRIADVSIDEDSEGYIVRTPYNDEVVSGFRNVPGRRWDKARKANRVPRESKPALWNLLRKCFPGATAMGPGRKLFTIPGAA